MSLKYFRRRVSGPETYTTNQNYYRDENLVGQKNQQSTQQQLHQQHNLRHSFINLDTNAKIYHHNTNPNTYELLKTTSCTGECFNPKNSDTYNLIDQDDYIDNELEETASNLDLTASVIAKRRLRKLTAAASKHADDRGALRHGGFYRPPKRHQSNSSTATASATTVLQTSTTTIGGGGGAAATANNTPTATTTSATTNCSRNNHHNCTCVSNCSNLQK